MILLSVIELVGAILIATGLVVLGYALGYNEARKERRGRDHTRQWQNARTALGGSEPKARETR